MNEMKKYFLKAVEIETGKAVENYGNVIDFMEASEFPEMDDVSKAVYMALEQLLAETFELNSNVKSLLEKEEA